MLVLTLWQVLALPASARAAAPGPLVLPADARPVNVWSVATMLADRPFTAIGRAGRAGTSARFCSPSAAWVWAKTPSGCGGALMPRVVSGNGWIVNIDFAVLNDVGIHLTKQGQRIQHAALGSLRPYSERPLCGHAPAMTLDLGADTPHELLIRVQTSGAMIPPIMQMALQWAAAQASPQCLGAVYLKDLDRFQPVNDTYGHDVGDNLLLAVRHRLRSNVRQHSVLVARLGGDDFIVMAHKLATPEQAHEWRPFSLCASEKSFRLSHLSIQMGLTIGYALADAAMYAGKEIGKHCIGRDPGELALAS